ncbi:hypothetical protein SKAU_G00260830 [Synaphobranchus kaupii]|uniref:Uncharacterized protein n=1 Tax=Synaphobranchus kaupii TaxID=118154 RepID=A0A9Q1F4N3_SYNKA|nr:hypothetical protein SKAU_G00260830 [Synaphobranchus kaupii]
MQADDLDRTITKKLKESEGQYSWYKMGKPQEFQVTFQQISSSTFHKIWQGKQALWSWNVTGTGPHHSITGRTDDTNRATPSSEIIGVEKNEVRVYIPLITM